jgi:hypothetical protein
MSVSQQRQAAHEDRKRGMEALGMPDTWAQASLYDHWNRLQNLGKTIPVMAEVYSEAYTEFELVIASKITALADEWAADIKARNGKR